MYWNLNGDKERHVSFPEGAEILISFASCNLWVSILRHEENFVGCSQIRRRLRKRICLSMSCLDMGFAKLPAVDQGARADRFDPARTINVPGYNAIICYRSSTSSIELRAYYRRADAFLTLDYFSVPDKCSLL